MASAKERPERQTGSTAAQTSPTQTHQKPEAGGQSKRKRDNFINTEHRAPQRPRVRNRCECPCGNGPNALPVHLVDPENAHMYPFQCRCTWCGPLNQGVRRCTQMLPPVLIALGFLCADCRDCDRGLATDHAIDTRQARLTRVSG